MVAQSRTEVESKLSWTLAGEVTTYHGRYPDTRSRYFASKRIAFVLFIVSLILFRARIHVVNNIAQVA